MKNVLIADDHEVTRRGIRQIVLEALDDAHVVEVGDSDQVFAELESLSWDLVMLDILMPGKDVLDVIRHVRSKNPHVPILVLTAVLELEYVVQSLNAGANGFIQKHRPVDELIHAIQTVAGGGQYLHTETAVEVASALSSAPTHAPHEKLSEREMEIFLLIARGRAVKEVAADLELSEKTVATYVGRIREKTGLMSYVDMARYALQQQLVD